MRAHKKDVRAVGLVACCVAIVIGLLVFAPLFGPPITTTTTTTGPYTVKRTGVFSSSILITYPGAQDPATPYVCIVHNWQSLSTAYPSVAWIPEYDPNHSNEIYLTLKGNNQAEVLFAAEVAGDIAQTVVNAYYGIRLVSWT